MNTIILTVAFSFVVILLVIAGMSVGVMNGRRAISGSCGGLNGGAVNFAAAIIARSVKRGSAMMSKSCVVKDYMAKTLVTFKPETDVLDAVHVLVKNRIAGAPVVDDAGNLIGMLSELDCMKVALHAGYHGDWGGPVSDFMSEGAEPSMPT